jgi:hemoglobin
MTMTLYEQAGGHDGVRAIADVMYDRLLMDDDLAPLFDGVELRLLRRHQIEFLTWALGGPAEYDERLLSAAHQGRHITDLHFERFTAVMQSVMEDLGMQEEGMRGVMGVIERSRAQVVEHRSATQP